MAFTKTPSTSKQWKSQSAASSSDQNIIITKQFGCSNKLVYSSSSKRKSFIVFLILFCFFCLTLLLSSRSKPVAVTARTERQNSVWFDAVEEEFRGRRKIKVGLVNVDDEQIEDTLEILGLLSEESRRRMETVSVLFDRVETENLGWKTLFPEWIDEDEKWRAPKCPEIPMPNPELYCDLDVVVVRTQCGRRSSTTAKQGIRDAFRLQVNLAAASVAVASGWVEEDAHRTVYVAFVGSCGPMREIFRCDDLVVMNDQTEEGLWVYRPEMRRLKQKILMPVGSCQLAPVYAQTGREVWRNFMLQKAPKNDSTELRRIKPREAYVTILHSSEAYVCGAIALAQSIIQTNSTKDLVLLADDSITPTSIQGLRAAGWKIVRIHRIRSPFAEKGSYNEWNYSKLRIWQLVNYDKIIFIDADLLVLKKIDQFFALPQLSAAANNKMRFNSGLMVVEPSACLYEDLMAKSFELESYNGGDQGFLNEVFTWWHRLPARINHLKIFQKENNEVSDPYAIHYLGLKPWMCYKDYDCNWDMEYRHVFASDSAHAKWWRVYEAMPSELQQFCGLTKKMDARIRKWRRIAKNASLPDGHWKIKITDPRRHRFIDQ